MSFSETTRYHQLIDGRILEAECLNEYGDWVRSAIDLNNYIGNINGSLYPYSYFQRLYTHQE